MRQIIDFRSSNGDTNYIEAAAILPVDDGEAANQTVLRRPTENVRYRTEVLRAVVRQHHILNDSTPSGLLHGGGLITFDSGTGFFTTDNDMWVMPLGTAGVVAWPYIASTKAALRVGTPSNNELVFTSVKKQWEGSSFPEADANAISVEIVAGASLTVTTQGSVGRLNHILITIISGTTTCNAVIAAVNASVPANTLVLASLGAGSTGTNPADLWGAAQWASDYTQRFLRGGAAGVLHRIEPTALAAFFAADPANGIKAGDTLAIWYDKNVDTAGTGGRFQSTVENANYNIPAGSFFNSTREPEKIPNSIPICKNIDGVTLLFADGSYIQAGIPAWLGADSWMLMNAHEGQVDTSFWYNDYFGIKKFNGGHGADPALTIQQALDNTDEQVHAIWGHTRTFVSVSDGVSSTGAQYNGASALQDAFTALAAAGGGTIFVKKGTYTITSNLTSDKKIHIIGMHEGVNISCQVGGYAFTFTANAVGSTFEHVLIVTGPGGSGSLVNVQAAAMKFNHIYGDGTFSIAAERCSFDLCKLQGVGTILSATGGNAKLLSVTNTGITGTGTGQQIISLTGGANSCHFDNVTLTVPDNNVGLNSSPGLVCTLSRFKVICSPFTAGQWVLSFEGGKITLDNVEWFVTGTGDIRTGLLNVQADSLTANNLYFDMNNQRLHYASANSPIILVSSDGEVNVLTVVNAGLIPDFDTDGFTLSKDVPYVRVVGFNGTMTIHTANISGFSRNGTPSGQGNFYCMGDECSGVTGRAIITTGRGVFEDVQIDLSGNTYIGGLLVAAFAGIQPASTFSDCRVLLGTTGSLQYVFYGVDTPAVIIDSCRILAALSEALVGAIVCLASGTGSDPLCWSVINNFIKFNKVNTGGSQALIYFGWAGGVSEGHTITSNRIYNTDTVAVGQSMIVLTAGVNNSTLMCNTIKKGNVGNTGISDAGSGNLWAGLNVG